VDLHQTPIIFMHMALSILYFKLACANKTDSPWPLTDQLVSTLRLWLTRVDSSTRADLMGPFGLG